MNFEKEQRRVELLTNPESAFCAFVELLQLLLLTFKQGLKSSTIAGSVADLNVAFVLKLLIRFCAVFYVIVF